MKKLYTNQKNWSVLFAMCSAFVLLFSTGVNAQTAFGPYTSAGVVDLTPVDDAYDGTLGSMASSSVTVSGVTGDQIVEISADLAITHTWIGDLTIKLENPDGDVLTLLSRPALAEAVDDGTDCCGTSSDWTGETVTFIDGGTTDGELLVGPPSGTYFPSPGSTVESATAFSDFFSGTVNGTWTLYVGDAGSGDNGSIDSWALNVVSASPNLEVFKTVALEDGNGDCSDDAEPPLFQSSLEVSPGDDVCYFYTAFNTGDVAFALHDIDDDVLGNLATGLAFALDTGAGVFVTAGPIDITANVTNTVTWDAYNAAPGDGAAGTATAVVTLVGSAPTNDNVCDAIALSPGAFLNPGGNSANATAETGEPVPPAGTGVLPCESQDGWCDFEPPTVDNSVWFTFVAPSSGSVTINTDGSYDTQLAVYEAASCSAVLSGGATLLAANDDNPAFAFTEFSSLVDVNCLTPGETYFIQVDGFAGSSGDLIIELIENPGEAVSGTISGGGLACDGGTADIFYNFTGTGPWTVEVLVDGSGIVLLTDLVDGENIPGPAPLTVELLTVTDQTTGCSTDGTGSVVVTAGTTPTAAFTSFQDPAGLDVDFTDASTDVPTSWAWDFGDGNISTNQSPTHTYTASGTYTVCLTATNDCGSSTQVCESVVVTQPVVVNDDACDALPIACGDALDGSTNFADFDASVTTAGRGVWYVFEGNGQDVTFSTCDAATFDTEITVQTGADCNSLSTFDANDDGIGCTGFTSELTIYAEFGTTYYVHVAHFSTTAGTTGDFTLSATCVCPTALDAGTLTPDASTLCLDANGEANLTATEGTAPQVPAGYAITYVLTSGGTNYVIEQTNSTADFTVTMGGEYTIHTLVSTGTLDLSGVVPGTTTAADVLGIVTGDDNICAALDVTGTGSIIVNAPEVGATIADATSVCLVGGSANIGGESDGNEVVPAGFAVAYVLTDADNGLEILDANATGDFTVNAAGNYIIHTLVYDPTEITDFAPFVGQSATVVVDAISIGAVCAALDVTGAPVSVNAPEVGGTIADASPVCLVGGSADIGGESDGTEVVPAGYTVAYVLTDADNSLEILDANATGDFTVNAAGNYIIHTLVYDPTEIPDFTPFVGQSATVVVDAISTGAVCAALDVTGAPVTVNGPEVGGTIADASPVCLDGGSADIGGESDGNEVVPAGYAVAYVLTDADNGLEILDANSTGDFTVNAEGNYIIHTLVYDPVEIPDFTPFVGQSATVVVDAISTGAVCAALDVTGAPIVVEVCSTAPVNDLCGGAITVNCGDVVAGDYTDATVDNTASDCGNTVGPGIWYVFTGTGDLVTVSTCGSSADTEISVYSGDCNTLTCVDSNDDDCGLQSTVAFESQIGTEYYINVAHYADVSFTDGSFDLSVTCAAPPTNQNACGAEMLSFGVNGPYAHNSFYEASGWETTFVAPEVDCDAQGGWCIDLDIENSSYYSFVAPASGNVTVSAIGSNFDTQIAVLSGTCQDVESGAGTIVGANDDEFSGTDLQSFVILCGLTPGETYYVLVDGWNGATGDLTLTLTDESSVTSDFTSTATELTADFTDASTAIGTVVSWAWDFGDGNTSTMQNPSHTYATSGTYTVCLTVTDENGCTSEFCDAVTVDITISIAEALENGMAIYPNPSNGEFVVEIRGVEADVQLNVLDLAGRVVYTEGAVLNGDFRKDLNLDVATGTYLLQIATEEGLVTRKIQIH